MDYFTSDTHFGHANIIRYCKRPFADVVEMNRELRRIWNETVGPRDRVFHLGDFALGKKTDLPDHIKKLNGYKILVKGNHDWKAEAMKEAGFDEVHPEYYLDSPHGKLFMRHIPDGGHRAAAYHLCGHVHDRWTRKGNVINVGVDVWGFKPRTLDEILAAKPDPDGHIPFEDQMDR